MTVLFTSSTCTVEHYGPLIINTLVGAPGAEIYDGLDAAYRTVGQQHKRF